MDKIWRLMTAIFMIAVAAGLFIIGWVFGNGRFNDIFSVLILYVVLFLVVAGIIKGLLAVFAYHNEKEDIKE